MVPNSPVNEPNSAVEPVLRTLSPRLRTLTECIKNWLRGKHRASVSPDQRIQLEGICDELLRRADSFDQDQPLLVVMFMGGTGVGKSTLLNALAGTAIAQASFQRPTTRDPVVYYHRSIPSEKLDPLLRNCRLIQHDRESLIHKVIVDTPDLDSNDLANRETLERVIPIADIVLYVGSQEKYHDQIGWEVFKQQRKRRAFAFVLNKWDRCLHVGAAGHRPDQDWLNDLQAEGFENPQLFRTVAQAWLDARNTGNGTPTNLPAGEQFVELRNWLEQGLTRLEIEAVKTRGVAELLTQLSNALVDARPPDLAIPAEKTQAVWERHLQDEAQVTTEVLLSTLEPYQTEIEHHFRIEGQHKFRGLYAGYLKLITRIRFAGSTLRERIPIGSKGKSQSERVNNWSLASFTLECSRAAGERVLDQRTKALINKLLVEADAVGYPLNLLTPTVQEASRLNWHERYDRALRDSLTYVEEKCLRPTGGRKMLQTSLIRIANNLPEIVLLASFLLLMWRYMVISDAKIGVVDLLIPFLITLGLMIVIQLLIALLLPLRWGAIRDAFEGELQSRLSEELIAVYRAIPTDVASMIAEERQRVEELETQTRSIQDWLQQRQESSHVSGLFGA
ncbi:GTPase [Tuwongella immobilis]|uniref:G domain-containing protein n=1 Tax=Tuwongella immobilis TaxID=692036 RepID=A0A6C2YP34_9BACT|nr:GTPase [Tuwongella immobilis]VIP03127.1 gtp-binding protein : Uncharacterized protein OS=Methylococcus capsulatus (strain ATCC 33009 / NCIMB 11132 / Bath) GN=MCA1394 PE=4 SV=1: MMR_HSR1 [Tuwongella immobilis]VTS03469.1 gtp-binding protein : Uncharacterized protein OS=Methylococcus capsulatus (strain ATCC 33009 / NCIMB 11132 / Bath) GN=MCA1394 PE=4 SV=1: MMR_HSR1 [Tuwongella immobilis]